MYKFCYDLIKTICESQQCLLYEIKSKDLKREISEKRNNLNELDLSNYPKNHPLYNSKNKMVVLKFKDGFPGDIITKFKYLKPVFKLRA